MKSLTIVAQLKNKFIIKKKNCSFLKVDSDVLQAHDHILVDYQQGLH